MVSVDLCGSSFVSTRSFAGETPAAVTWYVLFTAFKLRFLLLHSDTDRSIARDEVDPCAANVRRAERADQEAASSGTG